MAKNVEIKASLANMKHQHTLAAALADGPAEVLHQKDVFFHCERGRLKLRYLSEGYGELIAYDRTDTGGPKTSDYSIVPTDRPDSLCEALTRSLGVRATVCKTRTLFLVGRTRVHLDQVSELGDFLELEVVLSPDDDEASGAEEAQRLMEQLEIAPSSLIDCAYVDLIEAKRSQSERRDLCGSVVRD